MAFQRQGPDDEATGNTSATATQVKRDALALEQYYAYLARGHVPREVMDNAINAMMRSPED